MEKIRVGVVGATGYAGSEICRLIMGHPQAELAAISSVSFEGMALSQVYPAYNQMIDLVCGTQDQVVEQSDVVFAALPHGLSQDLAARCDALGKTFIDMGADFRLEDEAAYQEWYGGAYQDKALHEKAVYGLPEFFRDKCENLPAFVAAVNGELRGMSYRRQLRSYLSENRNVAWGQYLDISEILGGVAGELGGKGAAEPLTERRLLRYLRGLDMDAETSVYRDGSGRLRITIECGSLAPLLKE